LRLPNPKWREVFGFRGRYCEYIHVSMLNFFIDYY